MVTGVGSTSFVPAANASGQPLEDLTLFHGALQQASTRQPPLSVPLAPQRSALDPVADRMLMLDGLVASTAVARLAPEPVAVAERSAAIVSIPDDAPVMAPEAPPQVGMVSPPPPIRPEPPATRTTRSDFEGLREGQRDDGPDGPIARMQRVLLKWNPRLGVRPNGRYDRATRESVLLYKAIYTTGRDGRSMDPETARNLSAMEDGSFWKNPPEKSAAGRLLYAASRDLGKPYRLGADGRNATDCAMLTREALRRAGLVDENFTRCADLQFKHAERGDGLRAVKDAPQAGDLVFFNNPTSQSSIAYRGITHVGIYLGDGHMLAASSGHGRVVIQPLQGRLSRHIAGYARP